MLWTASSFFQCCHKIICDNLGKLQNIGHFLLENIGSIVPNIYCPDSKMKKVQLLTTSRLQTQPKRYKMLHACNLRPSDLSSLWPCHIVYSNNNSNKRRGLLWAWRWQTAVQPPHRLRTPQTPQQAAEREKGNNDPLTSWNSGINTFQNISSKYAIICELALYWYYGFVKEKI